MYPAPLCADECGAPDDLRSLIEEANNNPGLDEIALDDRTFIIELMGTGEDMNRTGDFDIRDDLIISGRGPAVTRIDGRKLDRVLDVMEGDLYLRDLSIVYGLTEDDVDGGGVRVQGGNLRMLNVEILGNVASRNGGGVAILGSGNSILNLVETSNNSAGNDGGGYYHGATGIVQAAGFEAYLNQAGNAGGGLYIRERLEEPSLLWYSRLGLNTAGGDGGGMFLGMYSELDVLLTTFDSNHSGDQGGGVSSQGLLYLRSSRITRNDADHQGGGIFGYGCPEVDGLTCGLYLSQAEERDRTLVESNEAPKSGVTGTGSGGGIATSAPTEINGSIIRKNRSNGVGGGIYSSAWHLFVRRDVTIEDNHALGSLGYGGGLATFGSALTLFGELYFRDNHADMQGGAIYMQDINPAFPSTIDQVNFWTNTANDAGGAIAAVSTITNELRIDNTLFRLNETQGDGGGLYALIDGAGIIDVTNTTFSGNRAFQDGGGVFVDRDPDTTGQVTLNHTTLTLNQASRFGGGVYLKDGPLGLQLESALIAKNMGGVAGIANDCGTSDPTVPLGTNGLNIVEDACDRSAASFDVCSGLRFSPGPDSVGAGFGLCSSMGFSFSVATLDLAIRNNGGPTSTHAIGFSTDPWEPFDHDGAVCGLAEDQRLFSRIGFCDAGAFER
ncbi:MAG: hypothetical protein AAFV53_19595 [Myxococcota bacterium]